MNRIRTGAAAAALALGVLALPATAGAQTPGTPGTPVTPRSMLTDIVQATTKQAARIGDALVAAGGTTVPPEDVVKAAYSWYQ